MAFQIKKDLHFGKGIYLELLDDLTNAQVKTDNFNNTKYTIPIKHIGNDITDGGGLKWFQDKDTSEWVTLKDGKSTDMEISEALYKQLVKYDKGSKVQVMMKDIEGKMGKFTGYDVKPLNGVASEVSAVVTNSEPKILGNPKKVFSNANYGITWGMCINNATQIVMNKKEDGVPIEEQVEKIARKLMGVAVYGLVKWEQDQHEKDQNSAPNDGDLPF